MRGAAWRALVISAVVTSAAEARAEGSSDVDFRPEWRRFDWIEGVITAAAIGGSAALIFTAPQNQAPRWTGGVLLDDGVRDTLRLSSPGARRQAQEIGTFLYLGALAYPFAVDVGVVAGGVHRNASTALQLAAMDAEVLSLVGVLNFGLTRVVSRQRPFVRSCASEREPTFPRCDESGRDYQSFFGGHAAVSFASAGLTCAHHEALPLYGGGAPDVLVCAGLVANGFVVAWTRLMADKHYLSDNLVGAGLGFALGYGVPKLLHYRRRPSLSGRRLPVVALPTFDGDRAQLAFAGRF